MMNSNSTYSSTQASSFSMSKVYAWIFVAILISAVTSLVLPSILVAAGLASMYNGILIAGIIGMLLLSFIGIPTILRTSSKAVAISLFALYAITIGVIMSPLILTYSLKTLSTSLFVTSGIFGIMAIYGSVTKRDLSSFGSLMFMLLMGCFFATIINIFIASSAIQWILSYVILAVFIGFVAFDIQRARAMVLSGQANFNMNLVLAIILYMDFANIFIRLVSIIGDNN